MLMVFTLFSQLLLFAYRPDGCTGRGLNKGGIGAEEGKEYKAVEATYNADYLKSNRLLGALPVEEFEHLQPHLETVTLEVKDFLYERDRPLEYVYFPIDCVTSTIATMRDGRTVEVGTIGKEGMDGLPVFLGAQTAPLASFCQIPGDAARMTAEANGEMALIKERANNLAERLGDEVLVRERDDRDRHTLQRPWRRVVRRQRHQQPGRGRRLQHHPGGREPRDPVARRRRDGHRRARARDGRGRAAHRTDATPGTRRLRSRVSS